MMAPKPLMLKDYLELESNYESVPRRSDSTTVRFLLEAELCGGGRLIRSRSKGALTKITSVINAVKLLSFSASTKSQPNQNGFLSRTFSKKIKRSFWKKSQKEEEDKKVRVKDIVRLKSFDSDADRRSVYFHSPVVSSCSSWSEADSTGSDFVLSSSGSSEFNPNPSSSPKGKTGVGEDSDSVEAATGHREQQEVCQCEEEEKEQLSPVSVMDFPYQDDEADEDEPTSPSFQQSLVNIERTKHQLLQKIKRFESLAELDPVDLEQRFASFEDLLESSDHVASDEDDSEGGLTDEITAWDLLQRLRSTYPAADLPRGTEKLLVDFFVEGLASLSVEELLTAARHWINGGFQVHVEEDNGELQVIEMERNGRWRLFEDGKEEAAAEVEVGVLGWLVEELVLDLAPWS